MPGNCSKNAYLCSWFALIARIMIEAKASCHWFEQSLQVCWGQVPWILTVYYYYSNAAPWSSPSEQANVFSAFSQPNLRSVASRRWLLSTQCGNRGFLGFGGKSGIPRRQSSGEIGAMVSCRWQKPGTPAWDLAEGRRGGEGTKGTTQWHSNDIPGYQATLIYESIEWCLRPWRFQRSQARVQSPHAALYTHLAEYPQNERPAMWVLLFLFWAMPEPILFPAVHGAQMCLARIWAFGP